ncbi:MAG: 7-cyano-7-deazaguanine synthase QueC [Psychrilyobacter sp.]|uniref:7-cyano-7-deazaguanine synthase QueC n=1 Tax=Psychrilyobacter sp. TaxID=2586924 RepID=UPI003C77E8AB
MKDRINKNSCVLVFSGGQDSTTLLFHAKKLYKEVIAISFNYGQKHSLELDCAKELCKNNEVEHHILDMGLLNQLAPNALTRSDLEVEKGEAVENEVPNTFVDGRNMIFLTFTGIFAKQRGINVIMTGVSQSDFSGYPDCRDVFIKSLNTTLNLAMDYTFVLETPLMWLDKAQTWNMAYELGVLDIIKNKTLTCYNGIVGNGCGDCPACILRKNGYLEFKENFLKV